MGEVSAEIGVRRGGEAGLGYSYETGQGYGASLWIGYGVGRRRSLFIVPYKTS